MKTNPIIVEQAFNLSVIKVWNAITELNQMKQWFFGNIPDFKPELGFYTEFPVQSGERTFTHLWEITEIVPQKKIVYKWRYKEYEGEGKVIFELQEQGNQTILKLTNEGLETFPEEIPEFRRESCEGGWNYFIKERLKIYLNQ
ncbi:MAG: ATPase [Marinilabiliales bacterium]|nr:MAG: ATPase [Marinilabiliales bacterium]